VTVDPRVVLLGTGVALALAVPFALVAELVVDDATPGALVFLFVAVILVALGVGGFVAGSKAPDAPISHGALAAIAAFVVVPGVSAVVNLVQGDEVHAVAFAFNALLATSMGVIGGLVAARRNEALRTSASPR
jgi:putative membrane protein (TIGR04086 family)